ncbi:hypothetical protein P3X46_011601 [Hevea brasiliensis]|uniref:Uncharacterized protein n=1 Tax=Hevea brasiliensis TaxID=3981 RepID=A0ABQ9M7K6_HEVBR|nr:uncharacterized protein LOC110655466 isoform X2 [Hevea brasiliensis]KAJ9176266.1 hypothetical protein P3X46_011601 [Hevea brasiliensis]
MSMAKPSSTPDSDDTTSYHSVFIDTALDTHLAMIISGTDTVSDLKQKIVHQHPLCFPQIGDIKIHSLKVKRRGCYYHLCDSMLVKSAFHGVNKSWFISVDASSVKEHDDNWHFLNPDSNNMVACIGISGNGSVNGVNLLADGHPGKLSNVIDKQHLKQKVPVADQLTLGVAGDGKDVLKNLEIGVEQMGDNRGKAKYVDINYRSDSHTQEKDDQCDNENETQKTPIGGRKNSSNTGIDDVQGSLLPESALETGSHTKKRCKGRKKRKHPVHDLTLKENDASLSQSGKYESQQETMVSQSFLENKGGIFMLDNLTGNKNIIDRPGMVPYSDANKGMDSLMQRAAVLSDNTGMPGKHVGSINEKSRKNCIDMQSFKSVEDASQSKPATEKKRKKKEEKKGDNDFPEEGQTLISDSNKKMLETPTISQHSLSDKLKNINARLDGSSTHTPQVVHLPSLDPTNEKRKKKKKSSSTLNKEIVAAPSSGTNVREENCGDPRDLGEEFNAEFVRGQCIQGVLSSEPGALSLKEKHGNPLHEENIRPSSQEFDRSNREAGSVEGRNIETVDPSKSSKKRRKSKKAKDVMGGTPSISVTEQLKGSVSIASQNEPHKSANGDRSGDNVNEQESNIPPKDRKEISEMDTISTSFLATDKEIDDVIQNVVESVQQIRKGQMDSENMDGTSRKKTRKMQSSDIMNFEESKKENENVGDKPAALADNIGKIAEVMKQAKLASRDSIIQLNGSNLDCEKDIRFENDPRRTQSSQVEPRRLESNSEGKCVKAVVNGNPPESGHANGDTDDAEVSCESNRINFNDCFVAIVGSAEVLVDRETETKRVDGKMKAKKNKRKLDAHSHGPSPDLQSSQRLNEKYEIGAKPQGDNSSSLELQSSLSNAKSEKFILQSNKEPVNASESVVKALPSSNFKEFDSVPEDARMPNAVKPSGTSARAKSKMAAFSSLESSKNTTFLNTRVNGHQSPKDHNHMDGKRTSTVNTGEVVNNSETKKSLIGASGSIFNEDSNEASSNEADNSDASTRTPSDNSLSSDYSDGESNTDFDSSQNGFHSRKRKEGGGKAFTKTFSSGMTLDTILRSSSKYKKAKLTASQSQLEDIESQPVDFVPDSQPNP